MGRSFSTVLSRNSASHRVLRLFALDSLCCFYLGETCELLAKKVMKYIIPGLCTQRKRQWSSHDIMECSVEGTLVQKNEDKWEYKWWLKNDQGHVGIDGQAIWGLLKIPNCPHVNSLLKNASFQRLDVKTLTD